MIYLVAGTRPNFMKIAPILARPRGARRAARASSTPASTSTPSMSDVFFRDLGMSPSPTSPRSRRRLRTPSRRRTVLVGVERDLLAHRPGCVVVVGDVTSTLAAALAAAKLGIPVAHVEAGLRSRDWTMPEEINRVLTDRSRTSSSSPRATPSPTCAPRGSPRAHRLRRQRHDRLAAARARATDRRARAARARGAQVRARDAAPPRQRRHRASALGATLDALAAIAARLPLLFPVHPRTVGAGRGRSGSPAASARSRPALRASSRSGTTTSSPSCGHALLVATDSGGIQEESTALGIPCLTLRGGTERPITVTEGTNTIVGLDVARDRAPRSTRSSAASPNEAVYPRDGTGGPASGSPTRSRPSSPALRRRRPAVRGRDERAPGRAIERGMATVPVDSGRRPRLPRARGGHRRRRAALHRRHTTVGVERTVARAYGIVGADAEGTPLVNAWSTGSTREGLVGRGVAFFLGRALLAGAASVQEAAEALAFGARASIAARAARPPPQRAARSRAHTADALAPHRRRARRARGLQGPPRGRRRLR